MNQKLHLRRDSTRHTTLCGRGNKFAPDNNPELATCGVCLKIHAGQWDPGKNRKAPKQKEPAPVVTEDDLINEEIETLRKMLSGKSESEQFAPSEETEIALEEHRTQCNLLNGIVREMLAELQKIYWQLGECREADELHTKIRKWQGKYDEQ